jgi:hypothetical protein
LNHLQQHRSSRLDSIFKGDLKAMEKLMLSESIIFLRTYFFSRKLDLTI